MLFSPVDEFHLDGRSVITYNRGTNWFAYFIIYVTDITYLSELKFPIDNYKEQLYVVYVRDVCINMQLII